MRRAGCCWWTTRSSPRRWSARWGVGTWSWSGSGARTWCSCLHLKRAEEGIALRIRRLRPGEPTFPPIDFPKALVWCQEKTGKRPGAQPAGGAAEGPGSPGAGAHRRAGCRQDHAGECHPAHPAGQEGALPAVRAPPAGRPNAWREATGVGGSTIHRLLEVQPGPGHLRAQRGQPARVRPAGGRRVLDGGCAADEPPASRPAAAPACSWWGTWTSCPRSARAWSCAISSRAGWCRWSG
jgi:hypothetical protein